MNAFIVHLAAPSTTSAIAVSCAPRSKAPRCRRTALVVASGAPRNDLHDVNSQRSYEQRSAVGQNRPSESTHVRKNDVLKKKNPTRDPVALGFADDYDRDYFDDLKAEYADDPMVTIYGKDDYELDNLDVDWLDDDIDTDKLRALSESRPVPDGFPFAPLRHTDIHSEERVRHFKEDACTFDPTSGVPWKDVPHDMHRYPECGFSDFRHDDTVYDLESIPEDLPFEPMKRRRMPEADELDALRLALCEIEEMENEDDVPDEFFESDGNVPQPNDDDFNRWAQASKSRGGDSSEHDSYVLPPVAPSRPPLPRPPLVDTPPQFSTLVRTQIGNWQGQVEVVRLGWNDDSISVISRDLFEAESQINVGESDLAWETTLFAEDDENLSTEHCSCVAFALKDNGEDLTPERAVFADGSYISHSSPNAGPAIQPMSLSPRAAAWLTEGSHPITEFSFMTDDVPFPVRTRVILCAHEELTDGPSKRKRALEPLSSFTLTHVITIRENRVESHKTASINGDGRLNATLQSIIGTWAGSGLSLQPLFPRAAALIIESSERWCRPESIELRDVHWAEHDTIEMSTEVEGDERNGRPKKGRSSKRVRAAAAYDARRLSRCALLCTEKIGDDVEKSQAWKVGNSEVAFSPRLGKFVTDCFAIALSDKHVLNAPCRKAWPVHQNQVALTEVDGRSRRRLVACRGVDSQLVGAVLLVEEAQGKN